MSKNSMLRLCILQLKSTSDKLLNLQNAERNIYDSVRQHKPRLITLPECFNCPYGKFRKYAEHIPDGDTCQLLSKWSRENNVYLVAGTIPEVLNDKIYNTCTVWCPNGQLVAVYRKIHLFDVNVKGGIRFKESKTLTAGKQLTTFEVDGHKLGLGICYDLRFGELASIYRKEGCKLLIYPGAFNKFTGPLHWELVQRSRANDNQLYVVTNAFARDETAGFVSFGHSMVINPWGQVVMSAKFNEEVLVADIDFSIVDEVRQQIPIASQRRPDLYDTIKVIN